jgi:hypothetical protein
MMRIIGKLINATKSCTTRYDHVEIVYKNYPKINYDKIVKKNRSPNKKICMYTLEECTNPEICEKDIYCDIIGELY